MSTYSYRYWRNDGVGGSAFGPLLQCPRCGHLFEEPGDVVVECSLYQQDVRVPSAIDPVSGLLLDSDGLIAKGYHNQTRCGHCDCRLIDCAVVDEEQITHEETG